MVSLVQKQRKSKESLKKMTLNLKIYWPMKILLRVMLA